MNNQYKIVEGFLRPLEVEVNRLAQEGWVVVSGPNMIHNAGSRVWNEFAVIMKQEERKQL